MSAPIKVRRCYCPGCEYKPWPKKPTIWDCTICGTGSMGGDKTISEAADAGRKHLRESHAPTARTQIHICTKCGLVSTCNRQPNGARA